MSRARSLAWAGALGIHALLLGGSLLVPAPRPELLPPVPPVRVTLARAPSAPPSSPREVRPSVPPPGASPATAEPPTSPEPPSEPAAPSSAEPSAVPTAGPPEPLAAPSPEAAPDYPRLVRDAIASRQVYPPGARSRRQEGTVVLSFSVGPGGVLVDGPSVVRSSSYPRLDAAALEAVRAAAPFVSPPAESGPWVFELPMEFRLARG